MVKKAVKTSVKISKAKEEKREPMKILKVLVGYPPVESAKGTALLSQNRQFQYFQVASFLFPVAMGTGATMARDKGRRRGTHEHARFRRNAGKRDTGCFFL